MGEEDHITKDIRSVDENSSKGFKFFLTYLGLYLAVWGIVFIVSRVCNPDYFHDSLEVSYMFWGFGLSIALAAVLGVIPAVILANAKKKEYVYFCVLGFLLINILSFILIGTALKPLCWVPVLYSVHFLLVLDALSIDTVLMGTSPVLDFFGLVIFPTAYYFLIVWISLRVAERRWFRL